MKRVLRICATGLVLAAALGSTSTAIAGSVQRSTSPVRLFSDGSAVPGAWSTLLTSSSGASFQLHTNGLPAGDEVTIWWVIFNHPENCSHGALGLRCGEGDLSEPAVDASVVYGAGHVIGGSGMGTFGGWIGVGDTDGALFGPGLTNPLGADIHFVVHDHGRLSPQQIAEGTHNFGPCVPECMDMQFSPHEQ